MIIRRSAGYSSAPRNYSPTGEPDKRTTEKALRDAGRSRKQAKMLLSQGYDATAAMNGWPVDLRDASEPGQPQPPQQRDAVVLGPPDILENLIERINKLTH